MGTATDDGRGSGEGKRSTMSAVGLSTEDKESGEAVMQRLEMKQQHLEAGAHEYEP